MTRDYLLWVWRNVPESDSARQALVRIFVHPVFREEITDVDIRGKILTLWLFSIVEGAGSKVPQLLDVRVVVGSNLTEPAIMKQDLRGGNMLVDNLLALTGITPHPDIVGQPTAQRFIDDVITEITDPNGQVNQGQAGTCSPTSR